MAANRQFRIQRKIATIPVVAGGFNTVDLPRGYDYETVYLRLYGGVQVTTLFAGGVRAEAPCQAISRVEVIADGRNTLHSAPMWFDTLARYDRRQNQQGARYTTPPSAASVATYQVEANASIDFMTPDGIRSKDSNLTTGGYQLFQIRLTFGNPADLFGPGAGAAVFNNLNLDISSSEMVELPDPQTGARTLPITAKKVSYQELAVPSSNVNQEVRLPAGNLIKSVVARMEGSVTAGEPSVAMLNNFQAFSGVDVRMNLSGPQLRSKNNNDFGYVFPGYYIFDATSNGSPDARLTELWDVTNQAEPKVAFDIVGGTNNKCQVVVTEYLALAQPASAKA